MRWNNLLDRLGNIPLGRLNILLPPDLLLLIVTSVALLIKTATTKLLPKVAMRPLMVATEVGMGEMHLLVGMVVIRIRATHLPETLAEVRAHDPLNFEY
jgi:hypothetical protein